MTQGTTAHTGVNKSHRLKTAVLTSCHPWTDGQTDGHGRMDGRKGEENTVRAHMQKQCMHTGWGVDVAGPSPLVCVGSEGNY